MAEDNDFSNDFSEDNDDRQWLTTLSDLCMLLLVFFIMLFAMSTPDAEKFKASTNSMRQALGGTINGSTALQVKTEDVGAFISELRIRKQLEASQARIYADVQYSFSQHGLEGKINSSLEKGIITLRVSADVLFLPGEAQLTETGKAIIEQLKDVFIKHNDQYINIKGYTADIEPQRNTRYADNWELSSMRSVVVLRNLLAKGLEANRLTATGLADLNPLVPNLDETSRAKNRRVEFVLEKRIGG